MLEKIEVVEFDGGYFAARRTLNFFFFKKIEYLSLKNRSWINADDRYSISVCFSRDLSEVKMQLAYSGSGNGTPVNKNYIISIDDNSKMNQLAETDEGMEDLLLKAKEYYLLKKK